MTRNPGIALASIFVLALGSAACGKGEKPESAPPTRTARTLPVPDAADPAADLPPGHPPVDAAAPQGGIVPPPAGSGVGDKGMTWKVPARWTEEPPSSSMRRAQYRVPGPAGDGECVVFYFGPGQGGDPIANAQRWAGQFKQPDGKPPEQVLKTSTTKVGDIDVLQVEVTGTYTGGMTTTMAPAEDKPGYMLLGAVAEGPDSNWFFKLTGPEATVRAQREAFEGMLRTLKAGT